MDRNLDLATRWLGILTTGVLMGDDAEKAALELRSALGGDKLADLRQWFATHDEATTKAARVAAVEGCIAIVRADRNVDAEEREAIERIIQLSELDDETQAALSKHIDQDVSLDGLGDRLGHPVLKEALLVLAWQLAKADGKVQEDELGLYGVLADKLGVAPRRASDLRTALGEPKG